jgi:hypothetical protein
MLQASTSPVQSEQWCCWIGRSRIIFGSARKSRQFLQPRD